MERKLATGGPRWSGMCCLLLRRSHLSDLEKLGPPVGSKNWKSNRRCIKRAHEMDNVTILGTRPSVRSFPLSSSVSTSRACHRNPTSPRLASSSKDGTVRVWSSTSRRVEYTLGGHTASVNVVRWGGGGIGGKGILYTASSDRSVKVWDANGVRFTFFLCSTRKSNCGDI
jgi:WD40 repeat protein